MSFKLYYKLVHKLVFAYYLYRVQKNVKICINYCFPKVNDMVNVMKKVITNMLQIPTIE